MSITIDAIPRRWGNSIAVIIPADVVENQKIIENEPIKITVEKKRPKAGVLWGFAKDWKRPTEEIKNEARAGWMSATDLKEEEAWKARQTKK